MSTTGSFPHLLQQRFSRAEERRNAYYAVRQLQKRRHRRTALGDLPEEIIQVIVYQADIDFSWALPA